MTGRCPRCLDLVRIFRATDVVASEPEYRPALHERPPWHAGCGGPCLREHWNESRDLGDEDEVEITERIELVCQKCGASVAANDARPAGACDGHKQLIR